LQQLKFEAYVLQLNRVGKKVFLIWAMASDVDRNLANIPNDEDNPKALTDDNIFRSRSHSG